MADALKDIYDADWIGELGGATHAVWPGFDRDAFERSVFDEQWGGRELKQRMRHITIALRAALPEPYPEALGIVRDVATRLGPIGLRGIVFPDFVECFGLDDWDISIDALERLTSLSSSEFAIRPFVIRDPGRAMDAMQRWALSTDEHVRRLASEGCRPRLPWAQALPAFKADPSPILPILDVLRDDPSEYVRRSVANNLNDIAKDHPDVVVAVLTGWMADDDPPLTRVRLARHALRSLVKGGHPEALALLGFPTGAAVAITDLILTPDPVAAGGEITFSATVTSTGSTTQALAIDYVIEFARTPSTTDSRSPGRASPGRKVFKLTTMQLEPGASTTVARRFSFRPITTRRYHPGRHAVEIQVNGATAARTEFDVG